MRKSGTPSAQAWMIKRACAREPIPRLRSSMEPFDSRLRARNELLEPANTATPGPRPEAAQTSSYPNVLWSITTPGPMVEDRVTRFKY